MSQTRTVSRLLKNTLPIARWQEVPDPRKARGRRFTLSKILQLLTLGFLVNCPTLRDVERLGRDAVARRELGLGAVPSDTTLERVIRLLSVGPLRAVLRELVRGMWRAKQLEPSPALPISLVAIDGKAIATDDVQLHPQAQSQGTPEKPRYVLRVLRAALVSTPVVPVLDQRVIPAKEGEANNLVPFVEDLLDAYGRLDMLTCFSLDAGFTSRSNLHWLHGRDLGFIAALKGDQPTLHDEAARILGEGERPPDGGWELIQEEQREARKLTLYFARTREMVGWDDWQCIRQVWRLRQRREEAGKVTWEDRFFLTNLPWGRLSPKQAMAAIRAHWGIENAVYWTLDAQWHEDSKAWVRQDFATEILGILRCIAYNLMRLLRHRTLLYAERELPWRELFELVRLAIVAPRPAAATAYS